MIVVQKKSSFFAATNLTYFYFSKTANYQVEVKECVIWPPSDTRKLGP